MIYDRNGWRLCENAETVEGSPLACIGRRRNRRPNGIHVLIQDTRMAATQEIVLQFRKAAAFSHSVGGKPLVRFMAGYPIADELKLIPQASAQRINNPCARVGERVFPFENIVQHSV